MSKLFKCSKCGKEFSYDSPALEKWAETRAKAEQIKCPDCFGQPKTAASKASTSGKVPANNPVSKPAYKRPAKAPTGSNGKPIMSAELLKAKYDELCEVFADDLDKVKDYLGGWTTTLALSETK